MICEHGEKITIGLLDFFFFFFCSLRDAHICESLEIQREKKRVHTRVNPLRTLTIITEVNSTHTVVSNTSIDHSADDVSTPLVHIERERREIDISNMRVPHIHIAASGKRSK